MSIFELAFAAGKADIDQLGHVNNAVWVRWIQDIATAHWNSAARPQDRDAFLWVVTRHEIDYLRGLGPRETVLGRTWVAEAPKGARFDRFVEFTDADGKVCVRARTTWAMIDRDSGRPVRVPPEVAAPFTAS